MTTKHLALLVSAMAAISSAPAVAQDSVTLTPFGAYRFGGTFKADDGSGSYDVDDSPAAGLLLNWPHRDNTRFEIYAARQDADAIFDAATINDAALDVEMLVLQLGGTYEGDGDTVRPYLAATIGGTHVSVSSIGSESDTFLSGSIGVGVLLQPDARLGLRLEARGHGTLINASTDLFCQTGPDINACALRIEGDVLWQIETFAGIVFRF